MRVKETAWHVSHHVRQSDGLGGIPLTILMLMTPAEGGGLAGGVNVISDEEHTVAMASRAHHASSRCEDEVHDALITLARGELLTPPLDPPS